jgi:hypothetical protein
VYPGSGATTDTQLLKAQRAAQQAALVAPAAAAGDAGAPVQPAGTPEQTTLKGPVPAAGVKAEEGAALGTGLVRTLVLFCQPVVCIQGLAFTMGFWRVPLAHAS